MKTFVQKLKTIIHYSLVCCPTLLVNVSNVLPHNQDGLYIFNGTRNERDYWIQLNGDFAMWYHEGSNDWIIGKLDGSNDDIQTNIPINIGKTTPLCPNDEKDHWTMKVLESNKDYIKYTWVSIKISMKCKGKHCLQG